VPRVALFSEKNLTRDLPSSKRARNRNSYIYIVLNKKQYVVMRNIILRKFSHKTILMFGIRIGIENWR
jgi:hypothetical protein